MVSGSEKVKEVNTKPAGGIIDLNEPIVKKNVTSALFLQSTTHILVSMNFKQEERFYFALILSTLTLKFFTKEGRHGAQRACIFLS